MCKIWIDKRAELANQIAHSLIGVLIITRFGRPYISQHIDQFLKLRFISLAFFHPRLLRKKDIIDTYMKDSKEVTITATSSVVFVRGRFKQTSIYLDTSSQFMMVYGTCASFVPKLSAEVIR